MKLYLKESDYSDFLHLSLYENSTMSLDKIKVDITLTTMNEEKKNAYLLENKITRGGMSEDANTIQTLEYIIDICTTKQSVSIGLIVMENMRDFQTAYSFFHDHRIITPDDSLYRYDFDDGNDFYHHLFFYCLSKILLQPCTP
jgi:hypothetical protein